MWPADTAVSRRRNRPTGDGCIRRLESMKMNPAQVFETSVSRHTLPEAYSHPEVHDKKLFPLLSSNRSPCDPILGDPSLSYPVLFYVLFYSSSFSLCVLFLFFLSFLLCSFLYFNFLSLNQWLWRPGPLENIHTLSGRFSRERFCKNDFKLSHRRRDTGGSTDGSRDCTEEHRRHEVLPVQLRGAFGGRWSGSS